MNLPGVVKSRAHAGIRIPFFVLCLLVWLGLRLMGPRGRRVSRWWIGTVAAAYLVLGPAGRRERDRRPVAGR
jgi:hypothetical protein